MGSLHGVVDLEFGADGDSMVKVGSILVQIASPLPLIRLIWWADSCRQDLGCGERRPNRISPT